MEMGAWISPVLTAALLACTTVGPALAGDYDGSKPLICAALQATSCQPNGQCKQGTAESLKSAAVLLDRWAREDHQREGS